MTPIASSPRRARRPGRGAALLLAMLILVLVTTLAASMVWIQYRGIEVEAAERVRSQGEWLLNGAIDWSRLILREDARGPNVDYIGEPWSIPLAETRLSTFLAGATADSTTAQADSGPDAFLSGQIADAQGMFNLQVLMQPTVTRANQQQFERLCTAVGVPVEVADKIVAGLAQSSSAIGDVDADDPTSKAPPDSLLEPDRVSELVWYGIDPQFVKMLEPFVDVLPQVLPVNANTAPAEVLMAMVPGLNRGDAQRMIAMRQSQPFTKTDDIKAALPPAVAASATQLANYNLSWYSSFFEVLGQLRYEQHLIRERTLVQRTGLNTTIVRRVRLSPVDS
jgi:general secretion pathway protein K